MREGELDRTFAALADPTRRAVIDLLRSGPRRAGELARVLSMSPPALSRHLRILRSHGLVCEDVLKDDARVRMYRLAPLGLNALRDWVVDLEAFWDEQLCAFERHIKALPPDLPHDP